MKNLFETVLGIVVIFYLANRYPDALSRPRRLFPEHLIQQLTNLYIAYLDAEVERWRICLIPKPNSPTQKIAVKTADDAWTQCLNFVASYAILRNNRNSQFGMEVAKQVFMRRPNAGFSYEIDFSKPLRSSSQPEVLLIEHLPDTTTLVRMANDINRLVTPGSRRISKQPFFLNRH